MRNGEVGYIHRLADEPVAYRPVEREPRRKPPTDAERHAMLEPLCLAWHAGVGSKRDELAALLGVSGASLDAIGVGWNAQERCWTFPERNHKGMIVGVKRRFRDGKKLSVTGGSTGLTFSADWYEADGPVFVVEGGSDVAAGLSLGLCVVGRPSNTGGIDYLEKLFRSVPERLVIIVGERDEKDRATLPEMHDPKCMCCGQCYPGKHGAIQSSIRLSKKLNRILQWAFVSDGAKDLRGWLNAKKADPNNEKAMRRLRSTFIWRITHGNNH